MTQEIKATFDGKQTKSVEAIMTMKVDESYADSKYSMKADASKMTDEAKSLFGFDTSADQSKEAAQKSLEDAGYTCK